MNQSDVAFKVELNNGIVFPYFIHEIMNEKQLFEIDRIFPYGKDQPKSFLYDSKNVLFNDDFKCLLSQEITDDEKLALGFYLLNPRADDNAWIVHVLNEFLENHYFEVKEQKHANPIFSFIHDDKKYPVIFKGIRTCYLDKSAIFDRLNGKKIVHYLFEIKS